MLTFEAANISSWDIGRTNLETWNASKCAVRSVVVEPGSDVRNSMQARSVVRRVTSSNHRPTGIWSR